MTKSTLFLLALAAASLLACGKPEEAAAPSSAPGTLGQAKPQSMVSADSPGLAETPPAEHESAPVEPAPAVAAPAASAAPATPPVGEPPSTGADHARGQKIYRQACAFCHDKGVAGAPKIGDAAAWSARVAQDINTLYASALHGKNAMPAKGGNPSLADDDVKAAVDFLAAQSR